MRAKAVQNKKVRAESSPSSLRKVLIGSIIAVGVIGLLALLYLNVREPGEIAGVVRYPGLTRNHDDNFVQEPGDRPPAGGIHTGAWQNCGVYREPINTGHAIHSLEHGAVWITYNESLSAGQIETLEQHARGQTHILVSPYPSQVSPVVLTAWGTQLEVNSVTDRRIGQFIERFQRGPQTPERGGSCAGGVGEPIRP
jgi:hypothetical protein